MSIDIGLLRFDHADYDAGNDVLYLHVGEPQPGEGEETPEGFRGGLAFWGARRYRST